MLLSHRSIPGSRFKHNSAIIAGLPADEQEAIFLNYYLIRQWFVEQYPNVFEPAEDQTKKEKSSWIDVYDAIVGDDIVKEAEYANLPISTVCRYLNKRMKTNSMKAKFLDLVDYFETLAILHLGILL